MTEENLGTTWLYILCSSLLLILFLANFFHKKKKKTFSATTKLPPGRRGWPIVGDSINWYNVVAGSHPPSFVEQQVQRFGNIFSCSLFGKWAVVSADPGDHQRKLHSIASNMMRLEKRKFHFLQDIQNVIKHIFITDLHDNQLVLLQDVCRKLAINLMVNQLLGVSSESEVNQIAQLFSDFADGCLSVPINLLGFAYHKAMKARESIISKINRTMEIHRRKSSPTVGSGVLGRLLEEESLPDDVVADFIINLLFAGNETTAKTMLFAIYFLTQCPRAMKQLLAIDETLRLGGIAIWLMREAKEDVEYQDYIIPKGSFVVPFLSAAHLSERVYEDAQSFNPWRWLKQENQLRPLQFPMVVAAVRTSKKLNVFAAVGAGNYWKRQRLRPSFQVEEPQSSRLSQSLAWQAKPRSLQLRG
ncbi:Abietadienol/abietadienal oxidase [Sesamum alatum]|uniref:Abietadienol/abietadienal oxidase n=1 Tax=Sesamum alatum TaxID=300844 RepID=A0AAE2CN13_9LAMI|nr:Abietadienol/abietadienal oxidase [Sesamum alatum]